jgi:tyrosinase
MFFLQSSCFLFERLQASQYPSNGRSTVRWPVKPKNDTNEHDLIREFQSAYTKLVEEKGREDTHKYRFGLNLTERSAYILLAYKTFGPMGNNRADRKLPNMPWANFGSLEDIHNTVHGAVGGEGNMGNVGIAAFDPIFWLHHAYVSPYRSL